MEGTVRWVGATPLAADSNGALAPSVAPPSEMRWCGYTYPIPGGPIFPSYLLSWLGPPAISALPAAVWPAAASSAVPDIVRPPPFQRVSFDWAALASLDLPPHLQCAADLSARRHASHALYRALCEWGYCIIRGTPGSSHIASAAMAATLSFCAAPGRKRSLQLGREKFVGYARQGARDFFQLRTVAFEAEGGASGAGAGESGAAGSAPSAAAAAAAAAVAAVASTIESACTHGAVCDAAGSACTDARSADCSGSAGSAASPLSAGSAAFALSAEAVPAAGGALPVRRAYSSRDFPWPPPPPLDPLGGAGGVAAASDSAVAPDSAAAPAPGTASGAATAGGASAPSSLEAPLTAAFDMLHTLSRLLLRTVAVGAAVDLCSAATAAEPSPPCDAPPDNAPCAGICCASESRCDAAAIDRVMHSLCSMLDGAPAPWWPAPPPPPPAAEAGEPPTAASLAPLSGAAGGGADGAAPLAAAPPLAAAGAAEAAAADAAARPRPRTTLDLPLACGVAHVGADVLRSYRYLRAADAPLPGVVDAATGIHADVGFLTVSPRSSLPGLLLLHPRSLSWMDVEAELGEHDLLVFAGECLPRALATLAAAGGGGSVDGGGGGVDRDGGGGGARFSRPPPFDVPRAPLHYVDERYMGVPRLSLPFFLRPRPDARFADGTSVADFIEGEISQTRAWRVAKRGAGAGAGAEALPGEDAEDLGVTDY